MKFSGLFLLVLFVACSTKNETIKIKGSDTEVNLAVLLAEQFHHENSTLLVSISGGGSGLGIASLLNGNATIANSSRSIKPTEIDLFTRKGLEIDSFIFAQDAIAFVTSDKLAMDSISTDDIKQVLSGDYKNWSSLTNRNAPITIYGRQSNSGTYDFVKKILHIHYSPFAKQMNGNAQIIEAIKADDSGIGYVSAGYVTKDNLNGLKILNVYSGTSRAVSPLDAAAIASGDYFFQRPLIQYYKKCDSEKVKPFIDFEKSAVGAEIIQHSGYYPVKK